MKKVTKKNVSRKYKQGNGYVVTVYSVKYDMWMLSPTMSYCEACLIVRSARKRWNTKKQRYN
jgi:hypothetical protein